MYTWNPLRAALSPCECCECPYVPHSVRCAHSHTCSETTGYLLEQKHIIAKVPCYFERHLVVRFQFATKRAHAHTHDWMWGGASADAAYPWLFSIITLSLPFQQDERKLRVCLIPETKRVASRIQVPYLCWPAFLSAADLISCLAWRGPAYKTFFGGCKFLLEFVMESVSQWESDIYWVSTLSFVS